MVGLVQGVPSANQPLVNIGSGNITTPWLMFLTGLQNNAAASITYNDFPSSLSPVGIASTLPSPVGYTGPQMIFLNGASGDGQLYRLVNGVWTAAIPAVNLQGLVTGAQIAPGTIQQAQVAINTVIGGTLGAEVLGFPSLGASGFQQAAISAAQIVAGSITAVQIAAQTIVADNIAAGTITAAQIAANTITATQISASYVYAGNISAAQISATSLSAITATLGSVTSGTITASTFETAASGTRTVVSSSSNTVSCYDSGGNLVFEAGTQPGNTCLTTNIPVGNPDSLAYAGEFVSSVAGKDAVRLYGNMICPGGPDGAQKIYDNGTGCSIFLAGTAKFGTLKLSNSYSASATAATGYIAVQDSTGTTYYLRASTSP